MHAGAWRRRTRAQQQARIWCRVRVPPTRRAEQELTEVISPAADVAADHVGIALLHIRWGHRVSRKDDIAKAWCEALNLLFDALRHVHRPSIRHVAIRPAGVMTFRRASIVEQTLLGDKHERPIADTPMYCAVLGRGYLFVRPADVHGCCGFALGGFPRNGPAERPVHFEHARTMSKGAQLFAETGGQRVTRNPLECARRHIKEDRLSTWVRPRVS